MISKKEIKKRKKTNIVYIAMEGEASKEKGFDRFDRIVLSPEVEKLAR